MDPHLQSTAEAIDAAINGISEPQLKWHPEGKWCAAEILEHLSLAYSGTWKGLSRLLDSGTPEVGRPTLKQRAMVKVAVHWGFYPSGIQAPAMVRPRGIAAEEAVRGIRQNLAAMADAMERCQQRFGEKSKILANPILGPLTLKEWRKFHYIHTRHHMCQIAALRRQMLAQAMGAQAAQ